MINYLTNYLSNTDYDYIESILSDDIKELLIVNQYNVEKNLKFLKDKNINIAKLLENRIDIIINDNEILVQKVNENLETFLKVDVKDYILFGI